jgi:hypothetical protein
VEIVDASVREGSGVVDNDRWKTAVGGALRKRQATLSEDVNRRQSGED